MSNFSIGDWVLWREELCYISDLTITEKFAMLRRKCHSSIYVPVKELSKPESKKETKNMQNKQVNVGYVVKADFNGTEADGVVTWVSSCGKVVIFQQQDTGHLFWTDVDNLIEVKLSVIETKESVMQEQEFQIGDKVVVPTPYGFRAGVVESVDYYEEEDSFYYEVDVYTLQDSADYKAEDIYDLEGLELFFNKLQDENVKVIDEVSGDYLVIDNYDNVHLIEGYNLAEKRSIKVEESEDSIIEELRDLLQQRSATGIRKYGTTLDRTDLDSSEWCQHLLEELLDASGYVLRLKKDLEALEVQ